MKVVVSLLFFLAVAVPIECSASLRASSTARIESESARRTEETSQFEFAETLAALVGPNTSTHDHAFQFLVNDAASVVQFNQSEEAVPTPSNADGDRELAIVAGNQVTSLLLINADTDKPVKILKNNTIIPMNMIRGMKTPSFNIQAVVSGSTIQSVRFGYNQTKQHRIENAVDGVFAFCGNNLADFYKCTKLGFGTHTVTATPFTGKNAAGKAGTPLTITFTIIPKDVTPPKLLNFIALSPTTVDVSTGSATVDMQVTVFDDASGFQMGTVGTMNSTYFYLGNFYVVFGQYRNPKPIAGEPITYDISFPVKQYLPPAVYGLQVNIADMRNNMMYYDDPAILASMGFPNSITVINTNPDTIAPQLVSLTALSPLTVNTSVSDATVDFEIVVQDDLSGIDFGSIWVGEYVAFGEFGKPLGVLLCRQINNDVPDLPAGVPHTFTVALEFAKGTQPGKYPIQLDVSDGVKNWKVLDSDALNAMGFPSIIQVVA